MPWPKRSQISVRNIISKKWNTTENDVSKKQSSADTAIRLPNTVGSLVVRASDSRPEGLGSMPDATKHPPSTHGFTCRNCGGGDRGRVAIYRPFGEFRRAKSHCHLYGAQGQRQAYLLPMPRSDYVRQKQRLEVYQHIQDLLFLSECDYAASIQVPKYRCSMCTEANNSSTNFALTITIQCLDYVILVLIHMLHTFELVCRDLNWSRTTEESSSRFT
ncbi:hypothetical protein TNCV_649991 [Trichonephila clavipes]|nr:hypothetical protein TNCV_649991 [Trichonephila clavipes]